MTEEATRSFYVSDEASAKFLLKVIRNDQGLTELAINFRSCLYPSKNDKLVRAGLVTRICKALKVNPYIQELSLSHADDLEKITEILKSNKTITKLAIHAEDDDCLGGPTRCLFNHGAKVEIHFRRPRGLLDSTNFASEIPVNATLTSLTLAESDLGEVGVRAVCKAVQRCSLLSKLDLSGNPLNSAGASVIGDMLRNNSTLTNLSLKNTDLGKHMRTICEALRTNSVLKQLNLEENEIGSRAGAYVAELLRENSTLTELCLVNNGLLHVDVSDALQQNTSLTKFEYGFCGDHAPRRKYLRNALEKERELDDSKDAGMSSTLEPRRMETFDRMLAVNQTLRVLDLSGSVLSYTGVEHLGDGLKSNKSLECLMIYVSDKDDTPCQKFCEGLKANCTLKMLSIDEATWSLLSSPRYVGATAVAGALAVNIGLEKLRIRGDNYSTECLELLAVGLEQNKILKEIALDIRDLDECRTTIIAKGLALNRSLHCLDFTFEGNHCVESLTSIMENVLVEELKFWLPYKRVDESLVVVANALKVNTSLKRLWLSTDLEFKCSGNEAIMEAYMENAAQQCEILAYKAGKRLRPSWFYYRLNRTGRLLWPNSNFPSTLWPRALVLADLRSLPESPDLLFHFIAAKPDMFQDCRCKDSDAQTQRIKKARMTKQAT